MKYSIGEDQEAKLVYSNSFATADGCENILSVFGALEVRDGALRCASDKTSGHSTAIVETPNLMDFTLSVDLVDRIGGGGVFFSVDGSRAKLSSDDDDRTGGYYAFVSKDGDQGAIGCTTPAGKWSGNMSVSLPDRLDLNSNLRLYVRSSGNYIIYTITDLTTGKEAYRYEYRKGFSRYDNSPYEVGVTALRLNNDGGKGGFKNLTIYERKQAVTTDAKLNVNEAMTLNIAPTKFEELITFTDANGMGFAFSYDASVERLFLYRYNDGELLYIAEYAMMLTEGKEYPVRIINKGNVLAVYAVDMRYPVLEGMITVPTSYNIGTTKAIKLEKSEYTDNYTGNTYLNPVAHGADPEILYYDGYYYLYNLDKRQEPNRVRVRRSRDLARWEEAGFCFVPDENTPIQTFMSPNVFFKDGLFYLLIASHVGGTGSQEYYVFYAHSDSPAGPFIMDQDPPYVNAVQEIGGAPFVDDDGRVYLSYVRFGGGNHVYVQEIDVCDGKITPVGEAAHCFSPTEHYEIDDYGRISEGGVITKHNGYYYMMYACGHFRGHYGEAYGVSKNVLGPYEKFKYNNPLHYTEYADGAGDCMFVPTPDGKELFVTYHKHTSVGNKGYDRVVCVDRVYFVPSEDGGPDVLRIYGPTVTPQPVPECNQ